MASSQTLVVRPLVVAGTITAASVLLYHIKKRMKERCFCNEGPVLCFGDSLTEGYHGVWAHPYLGPRRVDGAEAEDLRLLPYAHELGRLLATDAMEPFVYVGVASRYAECRAYSGWTAKELAPRLEAALRGGPWRCVAVLAGSNDVVAHGVCAEEALRRVVRLWALCDAVGVPVLVVTNPDCDTSHHGLVPPDEACGRRFQLARLAQLVGAAARSQGRVVVDGRAAVPMPTSGEEGREKNNSYLWDDSMHFSPAGVAALGKAVHTAVKSAGL